MEKDENKFKKAIVVCGDENTGKTTSLTKVWDKLKERGGEELHRNLFFFKQPFPDVFAIIKYKGCTILIYSLGDPSKHRGKTNEMKENYPESTWMYKHYFDSIADYLNIEILHSKEEKEKIEIDFRSKIDIAIGACHKSGETVEFWKKRVPNQAKDISWVDTFKIDEGEEREKQIEAWANYIIKELERLCNQLEQ